MLKIDVLSTILVQAKWVRDMSEGRAFVASEFHRHRPNENLTVWNTHVSDHWAQQYISHAVATRPTMIHFDQAFNELD
jgi:hypothetical protein